VIIRTLALILLLRAIYLETGMLTTAWIAVVSFDTLASNTRKENQT
jgi:hypothetical protein